ncbi:MAG: hypothetical protein [Cressdnaviricota sp.]|nr:MAG: hypothetical protein [Cressdnaviricota sp.]
MPVGFNLQHNPTRRYTTLVLSQTLRQLYRTRFSRWVAFCLRNRITENQQTGCIGESIASFYLYNTFRPQAFPIRVREDNTVYDFSFMCNINRMHVYVCVKASRTREEYRRSSRAFNAMISRAQRPHMVLRIRISHVNHVMLTHGRITYHVTINR